MATNNYGYTGPVPNNASIENNVQQALQYQATHNQ